MKWALMPLRRYADFRGRSTRREFWLFQLFYYVALFIVWISIGLIIGAAGNIWVTVSLGWLIILLILTSIIPHLSVSVRRLHDHDKSGWFLLLSLIPLIGWILWLFMMLTPGTHGGNSYGDDPRETGLGNLEQVFG